MNIVCFRQLLGSAKMPLQTIHINIYIISSHMDGYNSTHRTVVAREFTLGCV